MYLYYGRKEETVISPLSGMSGLLALVDRYILTLTPGTVMIKISISFVQRAFIEHILCRVLF